MKIEFTFDNITQLEELYYAVEHIPEGILEDEKESDSNLIIALEVPYERLLIKNLDQTRGKETSKD